MRTCELLILGGGHVAMGLAMAQRDSLICEESEFLDAGFSLTLKGFKREVHQASSAPGAALQTLYEELGLLSDTQFHCSALEIGASRFALDNGLRVLLKSRLLKLEQRAEGFIATLITNSGLETVKASFVADTRPKGAAVALSALFTIRDGESLDRVASAFPDSQVERSFCAQWGALHMPVAPQEDYNAALQRLQERWVVGEKLALIAPRLTREPGRETPTDAAFCDPLAAFEAGYRWGKEGF